MNRFLSLIVLVLTASCAHQPQPNPQPASTPADSTGQWPSYNNQLSGERFANLDEINAKNIALVKIHCAYDTKESVSFQTGLVEIDGALYATTEQDTFSIDPNTCKQNWRTHEKYKKTYLNVNRGVAVMDGRVFRGLNNGNVVAYDAKTGKKIWSTKVTDIPNAEMIDAAPVAFRGHIYIGNSGGDNKGVKGRMYSLNAATGKIDWSFYLVPKQHGDKTWSVEGQSPDITKTWANAGKKDFPITGGGVWTSFTIDEAANTLFVPGGNPAPDFVKDAREGENLYTGSVVELDISNGNYKNHHPIVLDDFHDYDVSSAPALIKSRAGQELLVVTPKDGHLYVIDRKSNKQLARIPMTTITNEKAPILKEGTRFCPGTQGGSEWNGPSYISTTNLIYSGQVDWCSTVRLTGKDKLASMTIHQPWTGVDPKDKKELYGAMDDKTNATDWVVAIDADSTQKAWSYHASAPVFAGVTSTVGDLVLSGDMGGEFFALNAHTGEKLFRQHLKAPLAAV